MAEQTNQEEITAVVSPRSLGGTSMFEAPDAVSADMAQNFCSEQVDIDDTARELTRLGFTVHNKSAATVSISGPKKLFQDVFNKRLKKEETEVGPDRKASYFAVAAEDPVLQVPGDLRNLIEGVAVSIPPTFLVSPLPPIAPVDPAAYRYMYVPDEVALVLRATRAHRTGGTGTGIKVAMPDTGFYRHPFYSHHGYRVSTALLGAGATDANKDQVSHGTGEAANVFAAAPDVTLQPVKMGDPIDSFKKAVASGAHVITNSWGYSIDRAPTTWANLHPYYKALALEVQLAINSGIVVCFSAGNGHYAFPASMPDVIAVGGVHVNYPDLTFEASSYASSFTSNIYPGRNVPDVCGLTGKRVNIGGGKAPSILLPVQPESELDKITPSTGANNDGWGLFSGTSAACPQVAGVVALMLAKDSALTPSKVKQNLIKTARDVKMGSTAHGDTAGTGPDRATGAGLVDAKWAYLISMGGTASRFFEASPEQKTKMLEEGTAPDVPVDFINDLIETLRSV
jgi:subtilisin family serine protease